MAAAIDLLLSSRTAVQFTALTHAVRDTLAELGRDVRVFVDRLPPPDRERVPVTIAPHDVYPHLPEGQDDLLEELLSRSVLVCCERPSAPGWSKVVPFAGRAGAVFDISPAGVTKLEEHRVPARRFRLGYHESFDRWGDSGAERPVDIAFIGSASPRRMQILAEAAPVLTKYDVDLRISDDLSAEAQRRVDAEAGDDRWDLLAQSKLVLNVHRDEGLSFEWLRAITAICNGCVFLTEEAAGAAPLEPDVHFHSGSRDDLPALADALLGDPERLARIRRDAYRMLREEVPLRSAVGRLAELADELPHRDAARRTWLPPLRPTDEQPETDLEPPPEDPLAAMLEQTTDALTRQGAVMKRLFFDLRQLRRQVSEVARALDDGDAPRTVQVTSTPGAANAAPDVTVLVSLYNYEGYVRAALESALRSEGVAIEIVVVDDASLDRSVAVVQQVMQEHPEAAITLLEQPVNTGVQRARNRALESARAPYVFVLDADNLVYPRGIAKLHQALVRNDGAAFAYGLIERFRSDGAIGLMNTQGWDVRLLADHHYIDAMALLRVEALRRVGGYVSDPTLELGWEDYDLWLSFAGAGYGAAHVREIVGRYRVHGVSSLTFTTLDVEDLKEKLRQRHAGFFASVRESTP
jgi:GT2 family glycosyltransferase